MLPNPFWDSPSPQNRVIHPAYKLGGAEMTLRSRVGGLTPNPLPCSRGATNVSPLAPRPPKKPPLEVKPPPPQEEAQRGHLPDAATGQPSVPCPWGAPRPATQEGKRSSICGRGAGGILESQGGSFPRPAGTAPSLAGPPQLTYRQGRWRGCCAGWARAPPRRCPGPPGCWRRRGCWRSPGRCWSRSGRSGAAGS